MDPQAFVEEESRVLAELLDRWKVEAEDIRVLSAKILELAAATAAKKLAGGDTTIEEQAIKASLANLRAIALLEISTAVISYIEGALIRVAKAAGAILLSI